MISIWNLFKHVGLGDCYNRYYKKLTRRGSRAGFVIEHCISFRVSKIRLQPIAWEKTTRSVYRHAARCNADAKQSVTGSTGSIPERNDQPAEELRNAFLLQGQRTTLWLKFHEIATKRPSKFDVFLSLAALHSKLYTSELRTVIVKGGGERWVGDRTSV